MAQRIALVKLRCPAHGQEHWLAVPDLPDPPPSPDVLARAVATHLWCGARPLAVDAVIVVTDPVALPWPALLPLPDDDAAPLASLPTPAPAPEPTPEPAPGSSASTPAPTPASAPGPSALTVLCTVVRAGDGARLEVVRFQPFVHRRGVDRVLGVRFRYEPALIAALKAALRESAPYVVDRRRRINVPGGWLPEYRLWFVEPGAWPWVRAVLWRYGYPVPEHVPV